MGLSLLGSGLIGGVGGAAAAEAANVTEANKQAEMMNLQSQAAAVNDMYQKQVEARHIAQGRAGAAYTGGLITSGAKSLLASQGKVMPVVGEEPPALAQGQTMADMNDIDDAMKTSAAQQGLLDTKTQAETTSKENITLAQAASKEEIAKTIGNLNVLARAGQGSQAASIAADAKKVIALITQERDLYRVMSDPLASSSDKARASQQLVKLQSGSTLPSSGVGSPDAGSTSSADPYNGFKIVP